MTASEVDRLAAAFRDAGVAHRLEEPLRRYTTIGLGGPAEILVYPASTEELVSIVALARELGVPVRVLGAGSNLIVRDEGVRGVVVQTSGMKVVRFGEDGRVEVEAGAYFPALVRAAAARGLRGIEAGIGIPGSVGGVLAMNAGAYDFSIGSRVESVTAVSPEAGRLELDRARVDFRYRTSSLGEDVLLAGCTLRLDEDDPRAIRERMRRHMGVRKATQPVGVKSAGCIFKNPPDASAGRIIDELGLKGLRVGGARVSEVHANFIVNDGGATTADVLALIDRIKERVLRAHGIELEEEVKLW